MLLVFLAPEGSLEGTEERWGTLSSWVALRIRLVKSPIQLRVCKTSQEKWSSLMDG
jgi:hypothetical protein